MTCAPRNRSGQNFLLDLNLTARIARAAGDRSRASPSSKSAPAPAGSRARCLPKAPGRVIAIERDARAIARACRRSLRAIPGGSTVDRGRCARLRSDGRISAARPARIVANLPYNIATPLLIGWLTAEPWPPWYDQLVADVSARSGRTHRRRAGRQSLRPPCRCLPVGARKPKILFDIAPSAFVPPPKVTSSVVRLVPRAEAAALRRAALSSASPKPPSASAARCCAKA